MTSPSVNSPLAEGEWRSPLCAPWCQPGDIPEIRLRSIDLGDVDEWQTVCWHASELLYAASGRQWRGAPGMVREAAFWVEPRSGELACRPGVARHPGTTVFGGYMSGSEMRAPVHHPRRVRLPDGDATEVLAVTIGDEDVEGIDLLDGGWVYRQRGFPVDGTRTVIEYRFGRPPGRAGVSAAADLAVELARWKTNDSNCQLPNRVTQVTREAVSWSFSDPTALVEKGFTGLTHVDAWLKAVNPYMRPAEAFIVSPDLPTAR